MRVIYTKLSGKSVPQVREEVLSYLEDKPFRVLAHHDFAATLAEKGFELYPYEALEICSAPLAYQVLTASPRFGQFMPCQINLYQPQEGEVIVEALWPEDVAGATGMSVPRQPLETVQDLLVELMKHLSGREPQLEPISQPEQAAVEGP